ncbi:MAG: TetR/AcrR family transcriptional regulator C-terminal domain-containing protein [Gammaproteobacteria bacterium]
MPGSAPPCSISASACWNFWSARNTCNSCAWWQRPATCPNPSCRTSFTQGARNTLQQLEQWLTALQQSGLLQCENPVRSAEALVGMLLRLDIVRNLYGVSVDNSEVELQAHARFVVDGFIRMHRG